MLDPAPLTDVVPVSDEELDTLLARENPRAKSIQMLALCKNHETAPVEFAGPRIGPRCALDFEAPLDIRELHRFIRRQVSKVIVASLPVPMGVVNSRLGCCMGCLRRADVVPSTGTRR